VNGARYAYLNRVYELIRSGEDIVIVAADYSAPVFDKLREEFSERLIRVGIAEQDMISISCGLAIEGKKVITYTLAPFSSLRSFDQLRSAVALMRLPITVVSGGAGVNHTGASHYATEDISIVRALPGFRIINVTDSIMGRVLADHILSTTVPTYVRFDKLSDGIVYDEGNIDFEKGWHIINDGDDLVIIATGSMVQNCVEICDGLKRKGISAKLIDLYALPFDKGLIDEIKDDEYIVSVEEHILNGGIGASLLEAFSDSGLAKKIMRLGLDFGNGFPKDNGPRDYLLERYGLSRMAIEQRIVTYMSS